MQMCLAHPTEGYYMNPTNPIFGARGDFTTSPEISQVFGEVSCKQGCDAWTRLKAARVARRGVVFVSVATCRKIATYTRS